jgi:hypothetical protein
LRISRSAWSGSWPDLHDGYLHQPHEDHVDELLLAWDCRCCAQEIFPRVKDAN